MHVLSARGLLQGHRGDRSVLDTDSCQVGDGQIIVAGSSLCNSVQKLAQGDRVFFAPHAALDGVMELSGTRRLASVVDRDNGRTSEHIGSQLLLAQSGNIHAVQQVTPRGGLVEAAKDVHER